MAQFLSPPSPRFPTTRDVLPVGVDHPRGIAFEGGSGAPDLPRGMPFVSREILECR